MHTHTHTFTRMHRHRHTNVCTLSFTQTKNEIEECREKRLPSPWRYRPVEESLRLFEEMRRGLIDEGKVGVLLEAGVWMQFIIKFDRKRRGLVCLYTSYDVCLGKGVTDALNFIVRLHCFQYLTWPRAVRAMPLTSSLITLVL